MAVKSTKIRKAARGRDCTVRIPGHCNRNPETVVLGHLPGGGMGAKRHDIHGAFICSACHDVVDRRTKTNFDPELLARWHIDGVLETQAILLNEGLIKV